MSEFAYEAVDVPATSRGRQAAPNPHQNAVDSLEIGGRALALVVWHDGQDKKPFIDAQVNLLRRAGRARGVTTRIKLVEEDTPVGRRTRVIFWVTPAQKRGRMRSTGVTSDASEAASPATEGAPDEDDADGVITTARPDQGTPPDTIGTEPDTETPDHAPSQRSRKRQAA